MYTLSPFTCARLKRLPKQPVVWEGDRRPISEGMLDAFGYDGEAPEDNEASDCILWVDATEGVLRAVAIIPSDTGPEAIARTLLQAMEHPQGAMPPVRPHKVVVRDREIQFFLRGALQNLDVTIDYVPDLPLIDEIFDSLQQAEAGDQSSLPEDWVAALQEQAQQIWENAPWNYLSDHHILSVTLDRWALGTLYISVLGMAGMEYGLLLYRSEESLKQFREAALLEGRTPQQMQQAFLSQDCLFLNFDLIHDEDDRPAIPLPWIKSAPSSVEPDFGSLHPLEGLRANLELEEAAALRVSLAALNQFFEARDRQLAKPTFPKLKATYTLTDPIDQTSVSVTVQTRPDIVKVLESIDESAETNALALSGALPRFRDELIPEGAIVQVICLAEDTVDVVRMLPSYHPADETAPPKDKLPVIVIQTSRPKAQHLVKQIQTAQGIQAVCFNPGTDPMTGEQFHLGLFQMGDGDFHLFVEFEAGEPYDDQAILRWQQWHQEFGGRCGVMIASGVTGVARGKPSLREMVAFFETRSRTAKELNLPPLQMTYALDWE